MLVYMAVPVLIMVGLCIFFYMAGRYIRIGKKRQQIKEPLAAKEPDRVPMLEEENRSLKEALEIKNRELEECNKAAQQKLEPEEAIKLKVRITQLEDELAAKSSAAQPIPLSYEAAPKEPEKKKKSASKKPKEKTQHKKPAKKIKLKPRKKK